MFAQYERDLFYHRFINKYIYDTFITFYITNDFHLKLHINKVQ